MIRSLTLPLLALLIMTRGAGASAQPSEVQSTSGASLRQMFSARAFPDLPVGEPVKCGLGVIAYAMRNRADLPVDLQSALSRILQRDQRQKSLTVGHFTVHYDTAGQHAAAMLDSSYNDIPGSANAYADSVAAIANRVFAYETGTLGYAAPPADGAEGGGPEYDIYVEDLSNEYGETDPETGLDSKPDGGRWITFMRVDNDFDFVRPNTNKGIPALKVTIAHELHHAIQLGSYGYWSQDLFFHELTSTWMEEVVFPGINDYLNYLRASWGHFKNPNVSFSSNDPIMYSRSIWGHFIAAKFGRDVMRAAWENVPNARPLEAMDRALQDQRTTFRIEFTDWVLWNYYTGSRADSTRHYPEGAIYPEIAQVPYEFVPPNGLLADDLQPLSARYHQIFTPADTVILIQTNVNRESADQNPGTSFPYSVSLASSQVDNSYEPAGNILYFKPSVSDPSNWKTMKIVHGVASFSGIVDGVPFPNPFRPTETGVLFIPAQADQGTLYVFTSSMDLVFKATETPVSKFGKPMFTWDGSTQNNNPAKSGIYVFVLSIPGKIITGKIALIRK